MNDKLRKFIIPAKKDKDKTLSGVYLIILWLVCFMIWFFANVEIHPCDADCRRIGDVFEVLNYIINCIPALLMSLDSISSIISAAGLILLVTIWPYILLKVIKWLLSQIKKLLKR